MDSYLAEVQAYDPALPGLRTLYFAYRIGFMTKPSDTPSSQFYEPRMKQPVNISRSLFAGGASTQGASRVGYGELILKNQDGALDAILGYGLDGRSLRILRSEVLNPAYSDYVEILVATMLEPEFQTDTVRIKLRDDQFQLDVALQPTKYTGAGLGTLEGAADLKGKPKPVCYGAVQNISPPCVETAKLIYQVNDGSINSLDAVYDNGVRLLGSVWTTQTSTFGSHSINDAAFGNGLFVIVGVGGRIATSPDGATWTARSGTFTASDDIKKVFYDDQLKLFLAAGFAILNTSPDGITWTNRTVTGAFVLAGFARGNGILVAIDSSGDTFTSPDAVTWTRQVAAFAIPPSCISFANGLFVVGQVGQLQTSPDGLTWTVRTAPIGGSDNVEALVYGNGLWVAGVDSGVLIVSADAITWSERQAAFANNGGPIPITALAYGNGLFLAGCPAGRFGISADGGTWINRTQAGPTVTGLAFGVHSFIAVNNFGDVLQSTAYATYATLADLLDNTKAPAPGEAKYYAAGGYIRVGAPPAGAITCDATQGGGPVFRTSAQIFKLLLARQGFVPNAGDITALDTANNSVIGLWAADEMTVSDACDQVIGSVGAWWGVDKTGTFRTRQLVTPSGTPVRSFVQSDLLAPPTRLSVSDPSRGLPIYRQIIQYGQNYTVQTSGLADSVSADRRTFLAEQWRTVKDEDLSVLTLHLLAPEITDNSLIVASTAAQAEATRRLTLRKTRRDRLSLVLQLTNENAVIDLGNVISVAHPRLGLSAGRLFIVLGVQSDAKAKRLYINCWG